MTNSSPRPKLTKFRAYDKATGSLAAQLDLPTGTTGGPMTFLANGRQLIVVPVGAKGYGSTGWMAFGLPVSANEPGVYSAAQAKHGEQLYNTRCAACPGVTLGGSEHAPGLEGGSFWGQWDGETVRHLYSRINSTMPPTAPGSLERTDAIDITTLHLAIQRPAPGRKGR